MRGCRSVVTYMAERLRDNDTRRCMNRPQPGWSDTKTPVVLCYIMKHPNQQLRVHGTGRPKESDVNPGQILRLTLLSVMFLAIAGCAVNPVTGKKQLSLSPESQELALGAEHYTPTQQTQGGQFYLDPELTVYVREVGMKLARVSDRPDLPYEFVKQAIIAQAEKEAGKLEPYDFG